MAFSSSKRRKTSYDMLSEEEGAVSPRHAEPKKTTLAQEWQNVALLVLLYAIQGVPLGLSMGSMPFLMQSRVSYTQIGLFSVASYPYSFKLLWSPLVDSIYSPRFGRRKSWIVPLQLLSGLAMLAWGGWVEARLDAGDAASVTALFFLLVLLAATQDIAVDGWALTLLSKHNLGYASTCQTVGMNCGYFTSFTIFLALSDPGFCNKYLREQPAEKGILTLSGYLRFWGWAYIAFTAALALFKSEGRSSGSSGSGTNGSSHAGSAARNGRSRGAEGGPGAVTAAGRRRSARLAGVTVNGFGSGSGSSGKLSKLANGHGSGRELGGEEGRSQAGGGGGEDYYSRQKRAQQAQAQQGGGWEGEVDGGEGGEEALPLKESYLQLWRVVRLPAVRLLAVVLVTCRLGVLPAEAAAPLKLLEKGATKEALAGLVLVTFPTELVSAVVAGRWATSPHPFTPWLAGYRVRLMLAGLSTLAVLWFPRGAAMFGDAPANFAAVAAIGVATSFTSTLMFTALGSFYNRISDPSMGGAYLTLLNTIANVGITVPKLFIFAAMDWLTVRSCQLPGGSDGAGLAPEAHAACAAAPAAAAAPDVHNACTAAGGSCVVAVDGFYRLSAVAVVAGAVLMVWLQRVLPALERLPLSTWRGRAKEY